MPTNLRKLFIRKWILTRMASHEFYFKDPFEKDKEYAIMRSILVLALFPIELIFVFAYARIHGSLVAYTIPIFLILTAINVILSNIIINKKKDSSFIDEIISNYGSLDYSDRKRLYSFKSIAFVVSLGSLLPWLIAAIGITVICLTFPR